MQISNVIIVVLIGTLAPACATRKPMALDSATTVNTSKESIVLLSVRTENRYKPDWQLEVWGVAIAGGNFRSREEYEFRVGNNSVFDLTSTKERPHEYLMSFQLPPGNYHLNWMRGLSRGIIITSNFEVPVNLAFDVNPREIIYLGRIEAILRERTNEQEVRAGTLMIPVIDQAITGMLTGTFDVTVSDNFVQDIQSFRQKYPALDNRRVGKRVLPPWTRPLP